MSEARLRRLVPGPPVAIEVDGRSVEATAGESLAATLMAAGIPAGRSPRSGSPRNPWCMIGLCRQCVATVDGRPGVRTCRVEVRPGMRVVT